MKLVNKYCPFEFKSAVVSSECGPFGKCEREASVVVGGLSRELSCELCKLPTWANVSKRKRGALVHCQLVAIESIIGEIALSDLVGHGKGSFSHDCRGEKAEYGEGKDEKAAHCRNRRIGRPKIVVPEKVVRLLCK